MSYFSKFAKIQSKLSDLKVSLIFAGVCLLLILTCGWAYYEFITTPPYVDPQEYPVRGIDVSSHNGLMNLDAAAADGIRFIFIKATEGSTYRDPNFRINYKKASHAGLKIGAYHFFRFDCDGASQAKNLLETIRNYKLDLGVAIDVEETGNVAGVDSLTIAGNLTSMVEILNLSGCRVTFYSNREGYYDYIRDVAPGACLWICSFQRNPINAEWTFWQYDHRGRVEGIRGDVDLDTFCGSLSEWENYLNGAQWPYDK